MTFSKVTGKQKYNPAPPRTITVLLILLCCLPSHFVFSVQTCDIKIFTGKTRADTSEIKNIVRTADMLVSRLQSPADRKKSISRYTIVVMSGEKSRKPALTTDKNGDLRFYVSGTPDFPEKNLSFLVDMISAMILQKTGISDGLNYKDVPQWIPSAILRKVNRRMDRTKLPGSIIFPGIHAIVLSGKKTDWLATISVPVPLLPSAEQAYRIYFEGTEIILDGIFRLPDARQTIKDLIALANKGISPEDAFQSVMTKKLNTMATVSDFSAFGGNAEGNLLEQWLKYTFSISSVNILNPCDAVFAEKIFRKAEVVEYTADTGDAQGAPVETRYCRTDELPDKLGEITNLNKVVLKKQRNLARIAFAMPIILQNPVYKMEKALRLLLSGKKDDFRKIYTAEKNNFFNALETQHKLEAYMLDMEKKFVPPGYRYAEEIKVIKHTRSREEKLWPELTEFLAGQER